MNPPKSYFGGFLFLAQNSKVSSLLNPRFIAIIFSTNIHFPQGFALKKLIYVLFLMIFISSCAPVQTSAPTYTAPPSATLTPMPTEAAPSMENLPAEWAGRIDRVETMTEMDGVTTRTVAIEKLSDEDLAAGKEAQLRTLQWDADAGEWVEYVPQVGLISPAEDRWNNVGVDNLPVSELLDLMSNDKVYGRDGQEIVPGVVGNFSDYTLLCGDVVETYLNPKANGNTNIDQVIAVPLVTGDIELIYVAGGSPTRSATVPLVVYDLASVDPQSYANDPAKWEGEPMSSALTRLPVFADNQDYWRYTQVKSSNGSSRRIIFAAQNVDLPANFIGVDGKFAEGEVVSTSEVRVEISAVIVVSADELPMFQ